MRSTVGSIWFPQRGLPVRWLSWAVPGLWAVALGAMLLLGSGGCSEPARGPDAETPLAQKEADLPGESVERQASPASVPTGRQQVADSAPGLGAGQSAPPAKPTAGYLRLVLLSGAEADPSAESADLAETSTRFVCLARASASEVGQALAELYPPVGPGGSENRHFLVYQSPEALDGAADLAAHLDRDAEGVRTGGELDGRSAFESAIPLYYELLRRRYDPALADEVTARLEIAAGSEHLPGVLRWASCLLAARIHADQRADPSAQKQAIQAARRTVPDDSFEAFLAEAALVDWYAEHQQPDRARKLAAALTSRFEHYRGTFAYDECLDVAGK